MTTAVSSASPPSQQPEGRSASTAPDRGVALRAAGVLLLPAALAIALAGYGGWLFAAGMGAVVRWSVALAMAGAGGTGAAAPFLAAGTQQAGMGAACMALALLLAVGVAVYGALRLSRP